MRRNLQGNGSKADIVDQMLAYSMHPVRQHVSELSTNAAPTSFTQLILEGTEVSALVDTRSGISLITETCRQSIPALRSQTL